MSFPLNLYVLSFLGAATATALTMPLWRGWCRRTGLVDDPGHRKIHDRPVPLAGGLAVLTGLVFPLFVFIVAAQLSFPGRDAADKIARGLSEYAIQLAAIFGGAAGMTFLGWLDDKLELHPALKFAGQLLVAGAVTAAGIRVTIFVSSPLFCYAVSILWILTVTNAFNFMDNMNGLCAGLGGMAALFIGLIAARHGDYFIAALAFLMLGASLGFLLFNFPRAAVFLGDSGSHLTGFLVSLLAILVRFHSERHPQTLAAFGPMLILAVPLVDLVWVVLLRWRMGKPFYVGDTNHLSHRLVRLGLSRTQTVVIIWLLAAGAGSLALLL